MACARCRGLPDIPGVCVAMLRRVSILCTQPHTFLLALLNHVPPSAASCGSFLV